MVGVLSHVRTNRDLFGLNGSLDELLEMEVNTGKRKKQRSGSMIVIKSPFHNDLRDDVSEVNSIYSHPGYMINIDDKIQEFEEYKREKMLIKMEENNKGEQWEEQEDMNIYASARDPE